MAFTTLTMFQLFNVFNARSDERSAFSRLFENRWLWLAIAVSLLLHSAVIYLPFLQEAFSTVSLGAGDCAILPRQPPQIDACGWGRRWRRYEGVLFTSGPKLLNAPPATRFFFKPRCQSVG